MATSSNQNDWMKDAERVFKKSVEANKQMMEESAATVSRLFSGKSKTLNSLKAEDFGRVMNDFFQVNLRYTESLIDLGLEWSKSVAELLQPKETATPAAEETTSSGKNAAPAPSSSAPSPPEHHEIVMSGLPGETIATSLHLQSSRPGIQKGRFEATKFRQEGTGRFASISLSFDPENFAIPPGEAVPATISAVIPENIQPATYRCNVVVHGFENTDFDLVVQVNQPASQARSASTKKEAPKKGSPKKKATG